MADVKEFIPEVPVTPVFLVIDFSFSRTNAKIAVYDAYRSTCLAQLCVEREFVNSWWVVRLATARSGAKGLTGARKREKKSSNSVPKSHNGNATPASTSIKRLPFETLRIN